MEPWFFLSPEELAPTGGLAPTNILLSKDLLPHLRALHLQRGDLIILADGKGKVYRACLRSLTAKEGEAEMEILEELSFSNEPSLQVTLFAGVAKGDKMDRVIRQSVELGVHKIVPVLTERSVIRYTSLRQKEEKARRWQKIALAAAQQCRRGLIPSVMRPFQFEEMLSFWQKEGFEAVFVPWEEEKNTSLAQVLENLPRSLKKAALFCGPEGGISPGEMERIKEFEKAYSVSLGSRILRAETAPLALLSVLMYHYEW